MTRAERIEELLRELVALARTDGPQEWVNVIEASHAALALPPDPARYPATVEGGRLVAADLAGYRRGIEDATKEAEAEAALVGQYRLAPEARLISGACQAVAARIRAIATPQTCRVCGHQARFHFDGKGECMEAWGEPDECRCPAYLVAPPQTEPHYHGAHCHSSSCVSHDGHSACSCGGCSKPQPRAQCACGTPSPALHDVACPMYVDPQTEEKP